jgi:hypothetical protein
MSSLVVERDSVFLTLLRRVRGHMPLQVHLHLFG